MGCAMYCFIFVIWLTSATSAQQQQINNAMYGNNNNNGMYNNGMYNNMLKNNANNLNINNVNNLNGNTLDGVNNQQIGNTDNNRQSLQRSGLPNQQSEDIDYGPAKFNFSYEVKQPMYGNFYGHQANRDGDREEGRYYVLLPNRRLMTVQYFADETGYHPTVTYSEIDNNAMFQNFLFAPEAKGSPSSDSFGMRTLTTVLPTLPPLIAALSTQAIIPNGNSLNIPTVSSSNQNNLLQFPTTVQALGTTAQPILTNTFSRDTTKTPTTTVPIRPMQTTTRPRVTAAPPVVTTLISKVTTARPRITTSRPRITTARPRITTARPRLTSTRPMVTTSRPVISTIRPRTTSATSFVGFASTLRPVTVAAPVTPLSSRSTTARGSTSFLFPKLDRNNNGNAIRAQGNNNVPISQAINPPSFSYLPPPPGNGGNNNNKNNNQNNFIDNFNANIGTTNPTNNFFLSNGQNGRSSKNDKNKINTFSPAINNLIQDNMEKPSTVNTGDRREIGNTGQISPPQSVGSAFNQNVVSNSNNIPPLSRGYLPPKSSANDISKSTPETGLSENDITFDNGFSFFEFNRITTSPVVSQSTIGQAITTQTPNIPSTTVSLPINRLTSSTTASPTATTPLPVIVFTQQSATRKTEAPAVQTTRRTTTSVPASGRPTTNAPTTRRITTNVPTTSRSIGIQPQRDSPISTNNQVPNPFPVTTTQTPSQITTEHEYDKEAGPAYIPIPGLTALIVDAPVRSGGAGQSLGLQPPVQSVTTQNRIPSTTGIPPTTLRPSPLPPRAKQLSPIFEFLKLN